MCDNSPGALETPTPRAVKDLESTVYHHPFHSPFSLLVSLKATASPLGESTKSNVKLPMQTTTPGSKTTQAKLSPEQVVNLKAEVEDALNDAGKKFKTNKVVQSARCTNNNQGKEVEKTKKDTEKSSFRKALERISAIEPKKTTKAGLSN